PGHGIGRFTIKPKPHTSPRSSAYARDSNGTDGGCSRIVWTTQKSPEADDRKRRQHQQLADIGLLLRVNAECRGRSEIEGGGQRQLALDNLALHQQLAVYKRTMTRPRLRTADRFFFSEAACQERKGRWSYQRPLSPPRL